MKHERKVHTKQVAGLHKKWEGKQILVEQELLTLQWDITMQVEIHMERNISNTWGSFPVISHIVITRV